MQIEIPVSELQKHKLFVATPMYGGQCFGSYTKSLLDLSKVCQNYGIQTQFSFVFNESLITRARNYLVDEFLRSNYTHLMFIDSDIDFNPMDVLALLGMNKPIVGGPYPKKCIAWENVYDAARFSFVDPGQRQKLSEFAGDFVFNAVPGTTEIKLSEPVEVLEIGTGFMLIERSVLTTFSERYPEYWYVPDHNRSAAFDGSRKVYQYFQAEIEKKHQRYLSEDYWFCQKAREAGMGVWLAPWMQIRHHGTYIYTGSIPAMAAVIHERMNRNEPNPSVTTVDVKNQPASPPPNAMTVKGFYDLSASRRKELLREWATAAQVDVDALANAYKEYREQWMSTCPTALISEQMAQLIPSLRS